jgi:hypothetical protein
MHKKSGADSNLDSILLSLSFYLSLQVNMTSNSTYHEAGYTATRTCSGLRPSPNDPPTVTPTFDSHTLPIIFGTIATMLAVIALVVTIAFGILQLRALNRKLCSDTESGMPGSQAMDADPELQSIVSLTTASHRQSQVGCLVHESELSSYVSLRHNVAMLSKDVG